MQKDSGKRHRPVLKGSCIMGIKNTTNISFKPSISSQACNGCEDCIEACTADVIAMKQGKAIVLNADDCQGCESCVDVCRENAIMVEETGVKLSDTCLELFKDIL